MSNVGSRRLAPEAIGNTPDRMLIHAAILRSLPPHARAFAHAAGRVVALDPAWLLITATSEGSGVDLRRCLYQGLDQHTNPRSVTWYWRRSASCLKLSSCRRAMIRPPTDKPRQPSGWSSPS